MDVKRSEADTTTQAKKQGTGFAAKLALLLSCDDGMVQMALYTPLMASIAMTFADAPSWAIDFGLSVTATAMLPAMLLAGVMAKYINKKILIIIGTAVFMAAGLAITVAPSIEFLIAARAVIGLGGGFAFPLIPSAISQLFDETEKNRMLGWMNAMGSFLSFVLTAVAGFVAISGWRQAFLLYLLFVPVIILQIFCLPSFKPEREIGHRHERQASLQEGNAVLENGKTKQPGYTKLGWRVWACCLGLFAFLIMVSAVTFRISLFIETTGMGNSGDSGMASGIMLCSSFITSSLFGLVLRVTKRYTPLVSLASLLVSFVLLYSATSLPQCLTAMVFQGIAMGTIMPYVYSCVSRWARPLQLTFAMSLVSFFQFGAQLAETGWLGFTAAIGFGGFRELFLLCGVLVFAAFLILTPIIVVKKPDYPGRDDAKANNRD